GRKSCMELLAGYASAIAEHWTIWLVTVVLILAAVIDGFELKVPNWVTFPFIISGWIYSTAALDRKSTRLNSSHLVISYAVFCLIPRPPKSTLFPYTTLFRSGKEELYGTARGICVRHCGALDNLAGDRRAHIGRRDRRLRAQSSQLGHVSVHHQRLDLQHGRLRSEEHTSELQSPCNLVCRLLLDTATTEIYTLSLHDALPIWEGRVVWNCSRDMRPPLRSTGQSGW